MKRVILSISTIVFYLSLFSQDISIHFDTEKGKLSCFYYTTNTGIFKVDASGRIDYVILGQFNENNQEIIDYFERNIVNPRVEIENTKIYTLDFCDISYTNEYEDPAEFKHLPSRIDTYKMCYFDAYYDDTSIKGNIKSIQDITLAYYTDYYLDDNIKGALKSIGDLHISYSNRYPYTEIQGEIVKIGDLNISYRKEYNKAYLNAKINSIGNYKMVYFDDYPNSIRNGTLKKIEGFDQRFTLITNN